MSKFTSRPRLIFAVGFFVCTGTLGYIAIAALVAQMQGKSFFAEGRRQLNGLDWFLSLFVLSIVVYLLWYSVWRWTLVCLDVAKQQVTVWLPFQFYKQRYGFELVKGFYLTAQWSKWCEIKDLVILLSTGKQIKFSDLETGNFREIEAVTWELFPFLDRTTKVPLTEEQKQIYKATTNKAFDYRQAKAIRASLIISLVGLVLIALTEYSTASSRLFPVPVRAGTLLLIAYVIYELSRIARTIQELRQ